MITDIEQFLKNENDNKGNADKPKISDYARIVAAIDQGLKLTKEFIEEFIVKENADLIVCLLNYAKLKKINIALDRSCLLELLSKSVSSSNHHLLEIVLTENEKSNHLGSEDLETALFDAISGCENYKGILLVRLLAEKVDLENIDLITGYPLWALCLLCSKQPEIVFILNEMISEKDFLLVTDRFPGILDALCWGYNGISRSAYCSSLIVPYHNRDLITLENVLKLGGQKLVEKQGESAFVKIVEQYQPQPQVKKLALDMADVLLRYGASGQEAIEAAMKHSFYEMIGFLEKKGVCPSENAVNEFISDLREGYQEEISQNRFLFYGVHFYIVERLVKHVGYFVDIDHKHFAKSLRFTYFLDLEWLEKIFMKLGETLASGKLPYGNMEDKHRRLLNRAATMFVAIGWNPSQSRGLEHIAQYAEDFEIPKTEHRRYIDGVLLNCAKIGDIETINLMLETGLRFRGDKEIASLERIIEVAKKQNHPDIEKLLIPLLEPAKIIQEAVVSFNKIKSEGLHESWLEQQMDMRLKLFKAIARNDQNEIISLVSNGANLNFGGLCAPGDSSFEYFNIGGAWESIDRVHPLYFACTQTMDKNTCISIFQLLIDLGANIHSANEYSLMRCGKDVKSLVMLMNDKNLLYRHVLNAELKQEKPCRRKEFMPLQKLKQQELKVEKETLAQTDSRRWLPT